MGSPLARALQIGQWRKAGQHQPAQGVRRRPWARVPGGWRAALEARTVGRPSSRGPPPSCASRTTSPTVFLRLFLSLEFRPIFTCPERLHSSLSCAGDPRAQRRRAGHFCATQSPDVCGGLAVISHKPESSQPSSPGPPLAEGGARRSAGPVEVLGQRRGWRNEGEKRKNQAVNEASSRHANRSRAAGGAPVRPRPPTCGHGRSRLLVSVPLTLASGTASAGWCLGSWLARSCRQGAAHTCESRRGAPQSFPTLFWTFFGQREHACRPVCVCVCVSEAVTSELVTRQSQQSESCG